MGGQILGLVYENRVYIYRRTNVSSLWTWDGLVWRDGYQRAAPCPGVNSDHLVDRESTLTFVL